MEKKDVFDIIERKKTKHTARMDQLNEDIRIHIEERGDKLCDYLIHKNTMRDHHRTAWSTLESLRIELKDL
jgi:hypothetical protein